MTTCRALSIHSISQSKTKTSPTMKPPILLTVFALLSCHVPTSQAQSARDIVTKHETAKVEALEQYLASKPDAADKLEALDHIAKGLLVLGDTPKLATILEQKYALLVKGVDANLDEMIGGVVQPLMGHYLQTAEKDKGLAFLAKVKADLAPHPAAGQIAQFLESLAGQFNMPLPGNTMEIAFEDLNGHHVDLSGMKDKVVLVDFWATWCGPCVAELPNVLAAYEKWHDKGFDVIGISLDDDRGRLTSFIETKKMTWPQYFDGKGWQNDLAKKYGINSIPATFLIGKDGKVFKTNLRGEDLQNALQELLAK